MTAPASALTSVPWTTRLASFFEETFLAIGRLDARVSVSPVASAWRLRASWTGYATALQLQSQEVDEADVFSWACGLPLPGRTPLPSHRKPFRDFKAWQFALDGPGADWSDGLPFAPNLPNEWNETPALLRALEILRQFANADGSLLPWLHMPILLRRFGITATPLPCLVIGAKALRFGPRDQMGCLPRLLGDLARQATAGLAHLQAIEDQRAIAVRAIADERRPGLLPRLLAAMTARPVVSPEKVSELLGITLSGAGKLLARAASAGLVREVSGRGSWRVYMAPDLAVRFGLSPARRGRPPQAPPLPSPLGSLSAVLADFDRDMAAFDHRFGPSDAEP